MESVVERLRSQKQLLEKKRQEDEARRHAEQDRQRAETVAAGKAWAEKEATYEQLRAIADNHGSRAWRSMEEMIRELGLPFEVKDEHAFVEGAMSIWDAVKGQLGEEEVELTLNERWCRVGAAKLLEQEQQRLKSAELATRAIIGSNYRPRQRDITRDE